MSLIHNLRRQYTNKFKKVNLRYLLVLDINNSNIKVTFKFMEH